MNSALTSPASISTPVRELVSSSIIRHSASGTAANARVLHAATLTPSGDRRAATDKKSREIDISGASKAKLMRRPGVRPSSLTSV